MKSSGIDFLLLYKILKHWFILYLFAKQHHAMFFYKLLTQGSIKCIVTQEEIKGFTFEYSGKGQTQWKYVSPVDISLRLF